MMADTRETSVRNIYINDGLTALCVSQQRYSRGDHVIILYSSDSPARTDGHIRLTYRRRRIIMIIIFIIIGSPMINDRPHALYAHV